MRVAGDAQHIHTHTHTHTFDVMHSTHNCPPTWRPSKSTFLIATCTYVVL